MLSSVPPDPNGIDPVIARYGTLKRWAEVLGMADAAKLLDATLQEEAKTDEALTGLADAAANQQAVAAE